MRRSTLALCALLAAISFSPAAFAQTRIGAASAVRNQVTATLSGEDRRLAAGNSIHASERIRTGVDSTTQLLFADQTNLTVGPRSDVTLDRYVYDPNRSVGDVAVGLSSGALRFVSGQQDPRSYQVRTPVATIGVRGTIVDFLLINGRMFAILDEGRAFFTLANDNVIELDDPGMAIEFFADGTTSAPFEWRGRYETAEGSATFPLFGNPFYETPGYEGANDADDATNRTDELGSRDVIIDECGQYCDY
jgi:hypothetical protein